MKKRENINRYPFVVVDKDGHRVGATCYSFREAVREAFWAISYEISARYSPEEQSEPGFQYGEGEFEALQAQFRILDRRTGELRKFRCY